MRKWAGLLMSCLALGGTAHADGQLEVSFLGQWGGTTEDGRFNQPQGVALDASGNLYVADTYNHRVQVLTSTGGFLARWGSFGNGPGQFRYPEGVAVDRAGHVYVTDSSHRVQKFTAGGSLLAQWGGEGSGPGQFRFPRGVAVDDSGRVYVIDEQNHRVQVFTAEGSFLGGWGSQGGGPGQLRRPFGIALDGGKVYVADSENGRVQVFGPAGEPLGAWGGRFRRPTGIAVDGQGNVYVADAEPAGCNCESGPVLQKYTANGALLMAWGPRGRAEGQADEPHGLAVDASGGITVADSRNSRLQRFGPDGRFQARFGGLTDDGLLSQPHGVAVDRQGAIHVLDWGNERVQKFTGDGRFLAKWGEGRFFIPEGIALDGDGNVYVSDLGKGNVAHVQKFNAAGQLVVAWGPTGQGRGELDVPRGIAADNAGRIYVADWHNNRVQVFDRSGRFLDSWGGKDFWPWHLAVDPSGDLYVSEVTNTCRTRRFSPDGRVVGPTLSACGSLAVDSAGRLYAEAGDGIQVYDAQGRSLGGWGAAGTGPGQFREITGIALDGAGVVYVTEFGNNRVQAFGVRWR